MSASTTFIFYILIFAKWPMQTIFIHTYTHRHTQTQTHTQTHTHTHIHTHAHWRMAIGEILHICLINKNRRQPAAKIQTKIYQIIDLRASSTKRNYRLADLNDHTSRSLTCTVTTRPAQSPTSFSQATVARLRTWSWRHGSQVLRRQWIIFGQRPRFRRTSRDIRRASADRHVALLEHS